MKPTEELTHEHDAIKVILDIMEKICVKIESGEKINSEHIEKIIEFIRIFADKCHHGKEENLLFTALEEAGMPRETGPIRVMLDEHKIGREYVGGLSDALEKYKAGDEKALEKIVENARGYIKLLRQHIDKEDNILYC